MIRTIKTSGIDLTIAREFSKLIEKGKLGISCDPETWIEEALDMPHLTYSGPAHTSLRPRAHPLVRESYGVMARTVEALRYL